MSALEIITTVLVSAGGVSAMFVALVKWSGRVGAGYILQIQKHRDEQETERLRAALGCFAEADKARFGAEHTALELIIQRRIETYPRMYAFLSDFLKKPPSEAERIDWARTSAEFDQWDSNISIWMSVDTSNCCFAFRETLLAAAFLAKGGGAPKELLGDLGRRATALEHALRTDIGLAGMRLSGHELVKKIEPVVEDSYFPRRET